MLRILQLIRFGLASLPQRKGSALTAMAGIAGVVAVLVGVLSIGQGVRRTMKRTGDPAAVMVLRSGADTEMMSVLFRDDVNVVRDAPGVAREGDEPLVSPELFVVINLNKRSTGTDANVPFRGVERNILKVRDKVKITSGRMFEWGKNEVIVGRGALAEFSGLDLGKSITIGRNEWEVVGLFESDGGIEESEIWTDAAVLAPAYQRGNSYQVILARLASAGNLKAFTDALTTDPRVSLKVMRVTDYYSAQSQVLDQLITGLGTLVAGLMGLGALFGALNTMYTAVAARSREIATLKALGFGSIPVVASVLAESMLLAALGGAVGAGAAWIAFDGYQAATLNWQSFSQATFAFDVNFGLVLAGLIYALVIGFFGGLLPAIRAARAPIATALREG